MDILVVVDMQCDFVTGALGSKEAISIVPAVERRILEGIQQGEEIIFTRDTHEPDYLSTQEGLNLPVPHCIRGTDGWAVIHQLRAYTAGRKIVDKPTFGSAKLVQDLKQMHETAPLGKITFIGLCTDICVISNAILTKAFLPEVPLAVDASCCAGVSPESHCNALNAMRTCQILIENEK